MHKQYLFLCSFFLYSIKRPELHDCADRLFSCTKLRKLFPVWKKEDVPNFGTSFFDAGSGNGKEGVMGEKFDISTLVAL